MSNGNDQKEKLLNVIREAIAHDRNLREKYNIGEKFRFIRDRLNALLTRVEEGLNSLKKDNEEKSTVLSEDETLVFVHLFNVQGLVFQTWKKMLIPAVFYEYSVNRPVYTEVNHIESFIRSKTNKVQHGFITVAIKKQDILPVTIAGEIKDAIGNPVVKVREGSLQFARLHSFTHNGHAYIVNEEGEIVKKVT